jgi:hypothetical protein
VLHSIIGYLQSVRLSNVARYAGPTFTPPLGDLTSDANTLLLLNFNEPAGSTTVQDSGPLGRVGTLATGFPGATPPVLGPVVAAEPPADAGDGLVFHAPAPNPAAADQIVLRFDLPSEGRVRLALHDVLGRQVAVFLDEPRAMGSHIVTVQAGRFAPGMYLVRLDAGGRQVTRRLTVAR